MSFLINSGLNRGNHAMSKLLFVFVLAAGLSACAGKVKETSCTGNNWSEIGYNTAKEGKTIRSFDTYVEACGDKLEASAKETYIDGYTKGIIEFCTYENGYQYGARNQEDPQVCPYEVRAAFVKGYKQGQIELNDKVRQMKNVTSDKPQRHLEEKPAEGDKYSRSNPGWAPK